MRFMPCISGVVLNLEQGGWDVGNIWTKPMTIPIF